MLHFNFNSNGSHGTREADGSRLEVFFQADGNSVGQAVELNSTR